MKGKNDYERNSLYFYINTLNRMQSAPKATDKFCTPMRVLQKASALYFFNKISAKFHKTICN